MIEGEVPDLKVELGLSAEARPSLGELVQRCRERVAVMVAGREDLAHLSGDAIWRSKIVVEDGQYQLGIPIEPPVMPSLTGLSGRQRANQLKQYDAALQEHIDSTLDLLHFTSDLVSRVEKIMDTSPHAGHELAQLERREGVDTHPIRRFLSSKQGDFLATLESESVPYCSKPVRASQQVGSTLSVKARFVKAASNTWTVKAEVLEVGGELVADGLCKGGKRDFRFADLAGWQRVALEAAMQFGTEVTFLAADRIGTCSLRHLPADVSDVLNWAELRAAALAGLLAAQARDPSAAANDESAGKRYG